MAETIDFHIHYSPEDMVRPHLSGSGGAPAVSIRDGMPQSTQHEGLFRIERHLECMDAAGVDTAVLSSPAGMGREHDVCAHVNADLAKLAARYPRRIVPLAHIDPRHPGWRDELDRCAGEWGCPGVAFPSSFGELRLDDEPMNEVYAALEGRGLFCFVHPAVSMPPGLAGIYDRYDMYRCVGREHELVLATYRLVAGGVFDRFPGLTVVMSHLGGGIAALLERVRGYQDKADMALPPDSPHARTAERPFDHYLAANMYFDTAGVWGALNAIRAALTELPAQCLVLGTDYPQEIRDAGRLTHFLAELRSSELGGTVIEGILGANGAPLLGRG